MPGSGITLVLTHRHEGGWLPWTVANAKRHSDLDDIIVIEDEPAVGVSARRHEGILKAKTKYVVVADAHMDFQTGVFGATIEHLQEHPKDVMCVRCNGIEEKTRKTVDNDRHGSRLFEACDGIPLGSRWYSQPTNKEIALVMGAFYAFDREWYMDQLGGVWQYHRGWGKSEQMISCMNWLCGGRNYCRSDLWASHLFRKTRRHDLAFVVQMRRWNTALIACSMADEEGKARILTALSGPGIRNRPYYDSYVEDAGSAQAIRDHLSTHSTRTWTDFRRRMLSKE